MSDTSIPRSTCIRPAAENDFPVLSELAFRSKAHWGYDPIFMVACRDDLIIDSEHAADQFVYVLEVDGQPIGFYGLRPTGDEAELTNLFVEPAAIGQGYGKQLWHHMVATARATQVQRIIIESDPHAEMFYRAMGAIRIGDVQSTVFPDRVLPLLSYTVSSCST